MERFGRAWTFCLRKERGSGGTGVVKVSDRATRGRADDDARREKSGKWDLQVRSTSCRRRQHNIT